MNLFWVAVMLNTREVDTNDTRSLASRSSVPG